ncbi:MAG: hypothetical protein QM791_02945 [Ferruginibacter sp.]
MHYKSISKQGGASALPSIISALLPIAVIAIVILYFGKPIREFIGKFTGGITEGAGKLTDTLGITTSNATKAIDTIQTNPDTNPFDPKLWMKYPAAPLIKEADLQERFKAIQNAWGYFSDNVPMVFAQFKACAYQTQVSWMAYRWNQLYKTDLLEYLRGGSGWPNDRLSDEETLQLIDYVKKLPITK